MKKPLLKPFVLFVTAIVLLTACKKNKDAPALTKENVAGTYKLTSAKFKTNVSAEQDIPMEACEKDDTEKLNLDLTLEHLDAGTSCSPSGSYDSNWDLSGNTITISGETYTVSEFTGTKLVVTQSYTDSGITYTITITMTKQ